MNIIIRELRSDHHNMVQLLVLMRNSVDSIKDSNSQKYTRLLRDCINYLKAYPDKIHHPKEDVVFNRLAERDQSTKVVVENLLAEHLALSSKTLELYEMVSALEDGNIVSLSDLKSKATEYIDAQIRHMRFEEASIFPMIEQKLTLKDWKIIIPKLPAGNDPLFSENRNKFYASLHSKLPN